MTLGLSLFLALTSVTLAVARGAPQPVAQIVLCTGEGARTVSVDAHGAPMAQQHVCPDCLLGLYDSAPQDPLPAPSPAVTAARHPVAGASPVIHLSQPARRARAPPRPA